MGEFDAFLYLPLPAGSQVAGDIIPAGVHMRIASLILFAWSCFAQSYDIILSGGRVVDGAGNPWFYGDVALRGSRIARIAPAGTLGNAATGERIDARNLVIAPGFIDIQSQSTFALLAGDGRVVSKVTQGVTTEIMGEGFTVGPSNERTVLVLPSFSPRYEQVRPLMKEFAGPHGFGAWLEAMERHGSSVNFGSFLGAGTVRMYAKGMAQGRATFDELETMCGVVRRAMEDGAFGIGSALIYPPGSYAETAELIELAKTMAPFGGVYITHMRSEGDQLLEALDEAIRIGREARVPVEIYHLKAAGRRNWPKGAEVITHITAARAGGQDIAADMYPYTAGATGLSGCLPPWASADGKLLENLRDPQMRTKIRAEMLQETNNWENGCRLATPDGVLVLGLYKPENSRFAGKRLSEIAAAQTKHWSDASMDLLISEGQRIGTAYQMMDEQNVQMNLRQPWMKIGTDADGIDPETASALAHPRAYGTYPRILGRYVRDQQV